MSKVAVDGTESKVQSAAVASSVDSGRPLAIFLPDLRGGGAERAMLNLAVGFADAGRNVHLVLASKRGAYVKNVPDNVTLVDLGATKTLTSLGPLIGYMKRERPSILLSALEHASIVSFWARAVSGSRTRIAVCVQNNLSTDYTIQASFLKKIELGLVKKWFHRADWVVAVSKGVADDLSALIDLPRERIEVIFNPVVTDDLVDRSKQAVDHPWFAAGEPPVILNVGRLTVQKDQEMLLRAFAKVRKSVDARLMILGEGEERPALEALAKELDIEKDLALPGFADNPFAYMNKAAVFALSSKYEGLPTVLIEALVSGARVVSTDCPSGPFEILENGKYGALVPVGDVDAMAEALKTALAGAGPEPGTESWMPYHQRFTLANYSRIFGLG